MKHSIHDLRVEHRVVLGNNAKIFLRSTKESKNLHVLELLEVAGYMDNTHKDDTISCIRIDKRGGSYILDLSMRLSRPEIREFSEVFIFRDVGCVDFVFRAVAKTVVFRPAEHATSGLAKK